MNNDVGFIWDIDGVIVDSPHEEAWRETARQDPYCYEQITSDFYFENVASIPRAKGANNILELCGIYEKLGARTEEEKKEVLDRYCREKNDLLTNYILTGRFDVFPDGIELLLRSKHAGVWQAAASASKNAKAFLERITLERILTEVGSGHGAMDGLENIYQVFDVDWCGRTPTKEETQQNASEDLNNLAGGTIKRFVVFEDAPKGVAAARSLGFYAVGVHRIGSVEALKQAGADVVVSDLGDLDLEKLCGA